MLQHVLLLPAAINPYSTACRQVNKPEGALLRAQPCDLGWPVSWTPIGFCSKVGSSASGLMSCIGLMQVTSYQMIHACKRSVGNDS
jgi:hypothetical protein